MTQKTMLLTDSSSNDLSREIRADRNVATTMPARIMVSRRSRPLIRPRAMTAARAAMAPASAANGNSPMPKAVLAAKPMKMAREAPQAAPVDTPRVKGSARGLRKIPWKAVPATARDMPTRRDRQTRLRRICQTTSCQVWFSEPAGMSPSLARKTCTTAVSGMDRRPNMQARRTDSTVAALRPAKQ